MRKRFSVTGTHVKENTDGEVSDSEEGYISLWCEYQDGHKRRTVKSDYLMGKWDIPNRGTM